MTTNVPITAKVHQAVVSLAFTCEEIVQFTVKIEADEMGQNAFHLPGLTNPKFIAIVADHYVSAEAPLEVMLKGVSGDPVPCQPVALFTANCKGGMQDTTFDGVPTLHFMNNTEQEARITVIAGE